VDLGGLAEKIAGSPVPEGVGADDDRDRPSVSGDDNLLTVGHAV
jgi:hypothetical protein